MGEATNSAHPTEGNRILRISAVPMHFALNIFPILLLVR